MVFKCEIPAKPTVQVDDDAVRITRWDFEPGAVTGWHEHAWPYFVVMLIDGTLRIHDGEDITDAPLKTGQSYRRLAGTKHDVMKASDHSIAFIEIEVKRADLLTIPPNFVP
jgi:quercetin dioxygenase-like cupin family protein